LPLPVAVFHGRLSAPIYTPIGARQRAGRCTRDLLPDLDHVITASYFDVYATMESAQAKYASLFLKNTRIAIYDGKVPVAEWLESL